MAQEFGFDNWNVLAARIGGEGVRFTHCAPIIRIFDTVKAKEFYLDFLGFARDWDDAAEWDDPARTVPLSEYQKSTRGPKKPKPKKASGAKIKHVATSKILEARKTCTTGHV